MKRQSDIGWFELIMGLILIILGIVIMRQPVGVLTWIVDALRNDLLYNFTDFEHSGTDRRNPSDLPSDDHDFLDGCSGRRIPDHRGSRMHCDSLYRGTLLQIKTEIITKMKYTESSQLL